MPGNLNKSVKKLADDLGVVYKDFLTDLTKILRKHDTEVKKLLEEEQKARIEKIRKALQS